MRVLERNPVTASGTPIEDFIENNNLPMYLHTMARDGTFGDHITLQRISEIYNVDILVISNLGPEVTRLVSPSTRQDFSRSILLLGHLGEGCGEHLSLSSPEVQRLRREASQTVDIRED